MPGLGLIVRKFGTRSAIQRFSDFDAHSEQHCEIVKNMDTHRIGS